MEFSDKREFRDDIKPNHTHGFDIRDSKVRMHSIGWLDDSYLNRRSILQPGYSTDQFTRIPPISSLPHIINKQNIKDNFDLKSKEIVKKVFALFVVAYTWLHLKERGIKEILWSHLPISYSVKKGAYADWAAVRQRFIKAVAPLIILFVILVIAAIYNSVSNVKPTTKAPDRSSGPLVTSQLNASPIHSSQSAGAGNTNNSSVPNINTGSSSNSAPGFYASSPQNASNSTLSGSSDSGSSGSIPSSPSSVSSGTSSSTPTSSTSSTSTSSPSSSSSTSSGSTLPLNVTVPAINTSLDGKTLLNTSPLTLTVN